MRKATVELVPYSPMKEFYQAFYDKIEFAELLQGLHIDFDKGIKIGIARYLLRDGVSLEEIPFPMGSKILDVLKSKGNERICLVRVIVPDEFKPLFREFDLELLWDVPTYATPEKIVWSVIGDQENLKKFFERARQFGEIKNISCQRADYQSYDALSCLTSRQRDVLIEAKRSGYYDYPRRINADQLSEKLGIGKSATIEHLRKAEGRIMSGILSGY